MRAGRWTTLADAGRHSAAGRQRAPESREGARGATFHPDTDNHKRLSSLLTPSWYRLRFQRLAAQIVLVGATEIDYTLRSQLEDTGGK